MATAELTEKLVDYIEDAHVMESNVLKMVESMVETTDDPEIRQELEHHREETERHQRLLRERLESYGREPSTMKEMAGVGGAMMKGLADRARSEKPARNARDGFVTEHLEIAAYELLERLPTRAGDNDTAEVARRNRADEETMAQKISSHWDKVVGLTLREDGIAV